MVGRVTVFIGSSWKMTQNVAGARTFAAALNAAPAWPADVQPFILPPATLIATMNDLLDPSTGVWIGAQNAHWAPDGPYTGEVSMSMVRDAGSRLVEIGHSERRTMFHETDDVVAMKVRAAIATGLKVLLCVGESLSVRDDGRAEEYVEEQAARALAGITERERREVMVAYEPVWSIGDDGTPADPAYVAGVIAALRGCGAGPVLYGGSVNVANARELLSTGGADGLFIGRAAWNPTGFLELVAVGGEIARERRIGAA